MRADIEGYCDSRDVFLDYKPLSPKKSQKVWNHSPDGFSWGYEGSGPAQLALAILLELVDKDTALSLYQDFKRDIIAKLPTDEDFTMPFVRVENWLRAHNVSLSVSRAASL
jgi:hypothetical protein